MAYSSRCSACGGALLEEDRFCGNCGQPIAHESGAAAAVGPQVGSVSQVERRYDSLRLIAVLFTVLAWLTVVFGGLGVIVGVAKSEALSSSSKFGLILGGLLVVAFYALCLFAAAAFIRLSISIEQNTRETALSSREAVEVLTR